MQIKRPSICFELLKIAIQYETEFKVLGFVFLKRLYFYVISYSLKNVSETLIEIEVDASLQRIYWFSVSLVSFQCMNEILKE